MVAFMLVGTGQIAAGGLSHDHQSAGRRRALETNSMEFCAGIRFKYSTVAVAVALTR